mmetsp:Transcript_6831/g.14318  ORF Transcript_6831/g.14318 Transcript_6831/m.14318 type:complete len:159 (-) Transcript_6831:82-558(-)
MKMGPMGQIMSMIPGFGQDLIPKGAEQASQERMKHFMTMMDSMTDQELDAQDIKIFQEDGRLERIAQGSGRSMQEVAVLISEHKRMGQLWGKMKGLKMPGKGGGMSSLNNRQNLQQMSKMLPPGMLNQMGGVGALQSLMKQLEGGKLPPGFPGMGGMM